MPFSSDPDREPTEPVELSDPSDVVAQVAASDPNGPLVRRVIEATARLDSGLAAEMQAVVLSAPHHSSNATRIITRPSPPAKKAPAPMSAATATTPQGDIRNLIVSVQQLMEGMVLERERNDQQAGKLDRRAKIATFCAIASLVVGAVLGVLALVL